MLLSGAFVLMLIVVGVSSDCHPADFVVILDSSGSVEDDFVRLRSFVADFAAKLTVSATQHRVALVEYSGFRQEIAWQFDEFNDTQSLVQAIRALPHFQGTTRTGYALDLARTDVLPNRRSGVKTVVLVLSDGYSQEPVTEPARQLRNAVGSLVFSVGMTEPVNKEELLDISGAEKRTFVGGDTKPLLSRLGTFLPCGDAAGSRPPVRPTKKSGGKVTKTATRKPAVKPKCGPADFFIVLDSSGSVEDDYEVQRQWVHDALSRLTISPAVHQVGLMQFTGLKQLQEWGFSDYNDKPSLLAAVAELKHLRGTTLTGKALTVALGVLQAHQTERDLIVIVVTDGYSQDDVTGPASAIRALPHVTVTYAVGVTKPVNESELLAIVGGNQENAVIGSNADLLLSKLESYVACKDMVEMKTEPTALVKTLTTPKSGKKATPRPGQKMTSTSGINMTTQPGPKMTQKAETKMSPQPGRKATPRPVQEMTSTAGLNMPTQSGPKVTQRAETKITPRSGRKATPRPKQKTTVLPGRKMTPRPGRKMTQRPGRKMTTRPGRKMTTRSGLNMTSQPEPSVTPEPGTKMIPRTQPKTTALPQPQTTPQSEPKMTPQSQPTTTPQSQPKSTPQSQPKTTPQSQPKTTPTSKSKSTSPLGPNTINRTGIIIKRPEPTMRPLALLNKSQRSEPKITRYLNDDPKVKRDCALDVLFIIDSSASIHQAQSFQPQLQRAAKIVDRMTIGPGKAKMALITFSSPGSARIEFPFTVYEDKAVVKQKILETKLIGGTTAAGDALELAAQELTAERTLSGGNKPVVIMFTDGLSQQDPGVQARRLRGMVQEIYAVSSGQYVNPVQLEEITGSIDRVFSVKGRNSLDDFEKTMDNLFSVC